MRLIILAILFINVANATCDRSKALVITCHAGEPIDMVNLHKLRQVHHALQYCYSQGVTLVRAKKECAVIIDNV